MADFIYRFEKLQVEALDHSDFSLKQKFICSLTDRFKSQLTFNEPPSFSIAKEQARRAEDLFSSQDRNTLELKGENPGTGKVRSLAETPQNGLGKIFSEEPGDQKQILGEVQECLAVTEKTLIKYGDALTKQGDTLSQVRLKLNMNNERNNNPNGRGKQNYKGSNNRNNSQDRNTKTRHVPGAKR